MTAIAPRLLVVLLVSGATPCMSAGGQARPDPGPQAEVSQAAPEQLAIDVARIRRLLAKPQPPGPESAVRAFATKIRVEFVPQPVEIDANGTLRLKETVNVFAIEIRFPTLAEQLVTLDKESRFPYSYAPSLQEITAGMSGLQYLHPVNAIMAASKAIGGALYRRKVEKARREVEEELRALLAHNAAAAAAASKPPKTQD